MINKIRSWNSSAELESASKLESGFLELMRSTNANGSANTWQVAARFIQAHLAAATASCTKQTAEAASAASNVSFRAAEAQPTNQPTNTSQRIGRRV